MADVAALLVRWQAGDKSALDEMLPDVYDELRRLARIYLSRERSDHTLQPTELVHEAYMRLVNQREVDWRNRAHFLGVAAQVIRRVLLHHAENRNAQKREGYANRVTLDEALAAMPLRGAEADVKFAQLLTRTTLRHLGRIDALLARYLDKPLPPKRSAITNALRRTAAALPVDHDTTARVVALPAVARAQELAR